MSRRAATLSVASALVLILVLVGALLPVPYVALRPGPTTDTLGTPQGKRPLIEIEGRKTYPTDGHLNFVTVAYQGGPGNRLDLITALRGWFDPEVAIVPEEAIFPRNESVKKVEQENTQQMVSSQQSATAAALHELSIPVTKTVAVQSTQKGLPADGRLKAGDEVLAVDGVKVAAVSAVSSAVGGHKPGDVLHFTVKRDGKEQNVDIPTVVSPDKTGEKAGKAVIGVLMRESFQFPFTVRISVGDVGGPSAGLMLALGIYDKLTAESITGGKFIAGTGTITPEGVVGGIGGIQQKMIAARSAGATIFLTPAANCDEAAGTVPAGLRLVKVDRMQSALNALNAIRTGQGAIPACTKG